MRLYCVSRYSSGVGRWRPGAVLDVDPEVAEFLLRDSPESFSTEEPAAGHPAVAAAAADLVAQLGDSPDLGALSLGELRAHAKQAGIDLGDAETVEDVRAAIQLAYEEAAAKLEAASGPAGGNTRPARKNTRSR